MIGGVRGRLTAAATQQPILSVCKPHLDRFGVSIPAVHFVAEDGFCDSCFKGNELRADRLPPSCGTKTSIPARRPPRPSISPGGIESIRHRTARIRQKLVSTSTRRKGREAQPGEALSAREAEILGLYAKGLRTQELAAVACCSIRTTKYHLGRAARKAGVRDRAELLAWWVRSGHTAEAANVGQFEERLARIRQRIGRRIAGFRGAIIDIERAVADLEAAIGEWSCPAKPT